MESFLKSIPQWGYQIFFGLIFLLAGIKGVRNKQPTSSNDTLYDKAPVYSPDLSELVNPISWFFSILIHRVFNKSGNIVLILLGLLIIGFGIKKAAFA